MSLPIIKVKHWHYRANPSQISVCSLETFIDPSGMYSILVTELGTNSGPSVTNSHEALREAIVTELELPDDQPYRFYERYDRNSYVPPRDDLNEISEVSLAGWRHVPEEEWDRIYIAPQRTRPKTVRRAKT